MLTVTCLFEDRLRNNTSVCRYEVESYGWIVRKDVILNISADFSFWVFAFYSFSTKDVCFLFFSLIHLSVNCKCDSKLLNKREIDAHRPYWLKLEITLWILLCRNVNRRGEWLSGSSCIIHPWVYLSPCNLFCYACTEEYLSSVGMKKPLNSFGAWDLRERIYVLRSLTFCLFQVR